MQRPVSSYKTLSEEYCGKNNDSDQQGGVFIKQRNGYVVFIQTYIFVWDSTRFLVRKNMNANIKHQPYIHNIETQQKKQKKLSRSVECQDTILHNFGHWGRKL